MIWKVVPADFVYFRFLGQNYNVFLLVGVNERGTFKFGLMRPSVLFEMPQIVAYRSFGLFKKVRPTAEHFKIGFYLKRCFRFSALACLALLTQNLCMKRLAPCLERYSCIPRTIAIKQTPDTPFRRTAFSSGPATEPAVRRLKIVPRAKQREPSLTLGYSP